MTLGLAVGSLAVLRAKTPVSPPAFQLPVSAQFAAPARSANGTLQPATTRVLRIYRGEGYFDDALAERLRPALAKAFPSFRPDPVKTVPTASVPAPVKAEGPMAVASVTRP